MTRTILMDQYSLSVLAPRGLAEAEYRGIRKALNQVGFRRALTRAIRKVFRGDPRLQKVRVTIR